ncbi:anhydro-N-acetylmuramic acid kinase [Anopheles sinensis]|uniref:Anhydro-N-acetylmuramic acid kinase n=1 Tax=Anopheles sinensis TaxID=74873 RepID=A0A084WIM8_ANOSI|nr:anhydro-N-acetylmuramic acid kinase [Anopheles sinensis]
MALGSAVFHTELVPARRIHRRKDAESSRATTGHGNPVVQLNCIPSDGWTSATPPKGDGKDAINDGYQTIRGHNAT